MKSSKAKSVQRNDFDAVRMESDSTFSGCITNDKYGDIDSKDMRFQEKERYGQDTRYRKYLAIWVMWIVPVWLACIILILCMCAAGVWSLTDVQMSTLLATTTANVLGLAHIVLKGLFQHKE